MERKSWDVLGRRMGERLKEFVEASLLETLNIIFYFVVQRQLELVKINLVT